MTLSYWPADTSRAVLDLTTGDALREAVAQTPNRTALVEVVPPGMGSLVGADATDRRWTYAELLAEPAADFLSLAGGADASASDEQGALRPAALAPPVLRPAGNRGDAVVDAQASTLLGVSSMDQP